MNDCNSVYGEAVYSADLYSWEVCWEPEVCGDEMGPLVVREPYRAPATANWVSVACGPLVER